ncbi:MAG: hypothetical protein MUE50_25790 [Pirellulaceae bacterium]|jgi:hypothetical protein|nr:hypothetical protein [Pirellulaceae bacterium]
MTTGIDPRIDIAFKKVFGGRPWRDQLLVGDEAANTTHIGGPARAFSVYPERRLRSLTQSTISGNTALGEGGGILNLEGDAAIRNSTLSGNTAAQEGGG